LKNPGKGKVSLKKWKSLFPPMTFREESGCYLSILKAPKQPGEWHFFNAWQNFREEVILLQQLTMN